MKLFSSLANPEYGTEPFVDFASVTPVVPDEIFKGSHFERRFVTPFGNAWEKLAVVAATEGLGYGDLGHKITGTVVCDVYAERKARNRKYAFELKAPLPNRDQTKVSKEKILKLYAMEPRQVDEAFYALPYNPYGRKEDYCWSPPTRWFNMREDPVVLIRDEFWEKIGGMGTYQAFVTAVNEIAPQYKVRIYREFLGMEPPPGAGTKLA